MSIEKVSNSKNIIIGITIFIIFIIIVIVIFIFIFISKNNTDNNKQEQQISQPSSTSGSKKFLSDGLYVSNIKYIENFNNNEYFENSKNIVFDSLDKIINNIDIVFNTYFPLLNFNKINDTIIKKTGMNVKDIIQPKLIENWGKISESFLGLYALIVLNMNDQIYLNLLGLYIFTISSNLMLKSPLTCYYYFKNDPYNINDFIIWTGTCDEEKMKIYYENNYKNSLEYQLKPPPSTSKSKVQDTSKSEVTDGTIYERRSLKQEIIRVSKRLHIEEEELLNNKQNLLLQCENNIINTLIEIKNKK